MINLEKPKEQRSCGTCEVCCVVMGIDILQKPPGTPCPLLARSVKKDGVGCGVYDTKPECCTEFKCLWLHGAVGNGEEDRPDMLGVMFDYLRSAETIAKVGNVIIAYEVVEGALSTERMKYWIKKMADKMPVVLNFLDGKKQITGRESLLKQILIIKDGQIMFH